jgi:hypothetical protein
MQISSFPDFNAQSFDAFSQLILSQQQKTSPVHETLSSQNIVGKIVFSPEKPVHYTPSPTLPSSLLIEPGYANNIVDVISAKNEFNQDLFPNIHQYKSMVYDTGMKAQEASKNAFDRTYFTQENDINLNDINNGNSPLPEENNVTKPEHAYSMARSFHDLALKETLNHIMYRTAELRYTYGFEQSTPILPLASYLQLAYRDLTGRFLRNFVDFSKINIDKLQISPEMSWNDHLNSNDATNNDKAITQLALRHQQQMKYFAAQLKENSNGWVSINHE